MSVFSNKKTVIFNIAVTVVLMAMNVAMSSFSVPVPGGHLYLNDVVICLRLSCSDPSRRLWSAVSAHFSVICFSTG